VSPGYEVPSPVLFHTDNEVPSPVLFHTGYEVPSPVLFHKGTTVVRRDRRRRSDEARAQPLSCKLVGGHCVDSGYA
jgi:hypothetical protein